MDTPPRPNNNEGGGRGSPNLAQRFRRQLSSSILPVLRNLVRSNRRGSSSRSSPQEEDLTELLPLNHPQSQPATENTLPPPPPLLPNLLDTIPMDFFPSSPDHPPPLIDDSDELPSLSSPTSPLAALNDLLNNTTDVADAPSGDTENTPATNTRQRYRLVVYFEERSPEEQPTARYVAVIVGRLDELQFLLSSSSQNERGFGDILNHLFNAYTPKGTPPASKDSIESLPTVTITEQEQSCMICLEQFGVGATAVVLPCNHMFHGEECVKTWLKMHNSCPICRYELPVEDAEYESSRKERMVARGFEEEDPAHAHEHEHAGAQDDAAQANIPLWGNPDDPRDMVD